MEVLHPRCAGLDVHKDMVVACLRLLVDGRPRREVRTFKTVTRELLEMTEWLAGHDCTHIVMEATGCTGSRSGTSWPMASSNCCWPTPRTSRTCRAARPM